MRLLVPGVLPCSGTSTVAAGSALLLADVISRLAASSASNMVFLSRLFPHTGSSFSHFSSPVYFCLCRVDYGYSVAADEYGS